MKKRTTKIYPFGIIPKEVLKVCFCAFLLPALISEVQASSAPITSELDFEDVQQQITGAVLDNAGIPLAGVNVLIDGTTTGTQTDFDGRYTIAANIYLAV